MRCRKNYRDLTPAEGDRFVQALYHVKAAAQRQAIEGHAEQRGATIIARFTEVESGRNPDRPELGRALHLAKVTGATLVIAKLDRLSRNAAFLLTLRDSGVRFVAVDMPEANDLTVGIMALVAQQEREVISKRTKEALAVAKARGVRLGNPNGAASLRRAGKGGAPLRAAIARNADRHARDLAPVIEDIRAGGAIGLRAIAAELNERGMLTRRGGRWHVSTVMNLLDRLGLRDGSCASPR
jgi:DNA invertase Pin-like site-specific DNA recombinase